MKTNVTDLPEEIQEMLSEFSDIVVDDLTNELSPRWYISHQIDFYSRIQFIKQGSVYIDTSRE